MRNTRNVVSFILLFLFVNSSFARQSPNTTAHALSESAILVEGKLIQSSLGAQDFRLFSAESVELRIISVLPSRAHKILVIPEEKLDPRALYTLTVKGHEERIFVRRDAWFSTLYSSKPLGATVAEDESETTFRVFAPRASAVKLHLYLEVDADLEQPEKSIDLVRDSDGVWETSEAGNHHGVFYTYTVYGPDEPGNYFYGTHPVHITDPYALVSDDSFGKSMVFVPRPAPAAVRGGRPKMEDVVAYEVHVQDFSDLLPVPSDQKGTFSGMIATGLKNENGSPIGFDHLVNLGINVVHLMPVQEFLHYPDSEWQDAFSDDPFMREQGIGEENYQWGYRTTHAFAVESRYRRSGSPIGSERNQFRELVAAFHKEGISVIIDVVPNHTGENMDGRHHLLNFNVLDLPYYYRTDSELQHIGPFGNEVKSEDRPMVQRWILDQLEHFVEVFGLDGFRIDLAGQIDEQTLSWLKSRLPEDLIIYGEAWIAPSDPEVAGDPDLFWYKADAPITFFQDDARNAFKGPVSNPSDRAVDRGFAGGDGSVRQNAQMGLLNSFAEEGDPNRGINYLDIHDNWTLADRFSNVDWDGRKHVDEAAFRLAATLLFTSLGPIVLHGGTEMMRSKAHAPLEELIKTTSTGDLFFHGKRDTYNLRRANQFVWENVGARPTDERPMDYQSMIDYFRGLAGFRMGEVGSVFRVGGDIPADYYEWIAPANELLLGYIVDKSVLVLMNTSADSTEFILPDLGAQNWKQVSDGLQFLEDGCACSNDLRVGQKSVIIPPKRAMIFKRSDSP